MASDVTIRNALSADQAALGGLWLAFLQEQAALDDRVSVSEDALQRWHNDFPSWIDRDQRHILVAERTGSLVGFVAAVRHAPPPIFEYLQEVYLEELYVAPDVRRQGIGRALYEGMRNWAAEWGAERLRLNVLALNQQARAFWVGLGFTELSVSMASEIASEAKQKVQERGRIGFGA